MPALVLSLQYQVYALHPHPALLSMCSSRSICDGGGRVVSTMTKLIIVSSILSIAYGLHLQAHFAQGTKYYLLIKVLATAINPALKKLYL